MAESTEHESQPWTLPGLLGEAKELVVAEVYRLLAEEGFGELRPSHGYIFRCIDEDGSRLTDLAERAGFTKQAVGEVVTNLERLGHVQRSGDPEDGRARIIHLTDRGRRAQAAIARLVSQTERLWAERYGTQRIAELRETLKRIVTFEPGGHTN